VGGGGGQKKEGRVTKYVGDSPTFAEEKEKTTCTRNKKKKGHLFAGKRGQKDRRKRWERFPAEKNQGGNSEETYRDLLRRKKVV